LQAILLAIPSICIEITEKYHDDWFTEIVMIIHSILRLAARKKSHFSFVRYRTLRCHSAESLFRVRKQKELLTGLDIPGVEEHKSAGRTIESAIHAAKDLHRQTLSTLGQQLRLVRRSRVLSLQTKKKYTGTYRVCQTARQPSAAVEGTDVLGDDMNSRAILSRNPTATQTFESFAKRRRTKKNITFNEVKPTRIDLSS
jgi:hypothetical protein